MVIFTDAIEVAAQSIDLKNKCKGKFMNKSQVTEMRRILKKDVPNWLLEVNISYRDLIKENFNDAVLTSEKQKEAFTQLISLSQSINKCSDTHRILIKNRYLKHLSAKAMMGKMMIRHSRYYDIENESLFELSKRYL